MVNHIPSICKNTNGIYNKENPRFDFARIFSCGFGGRSNFQSAISELGSLGSSSAVVGCSFSKNKMEVFD